MKRIVATLAIAVLTLHGSVAYASATSSALLSNLEIKLYDLDTNDGITPSISFKSYSSFYSFIGTNDFNRNYLQYSNPDLIPFGTGSTSLIKDNTFSITSGVGSGLSIATEPLTQVFGGLYAAGSTEIKPSSKNIFESDYSSFANWLNYFTLTANSLVEFTATGTAFTTIASSPSTNSSQFAQSWTRLQTSRISPDGRNRYDFVESYIDSYNNKSMDTGTMTVVFTNNTQNSTDGFFGAAALANGFIYTTSPQIPAVPEPQTALLFAAGTWIVGRMSSRKNGKYQSSLGTHRN